MRWWAAAAAIAALGIGAAITHEAGVWGDGGSDPKLRLPEIDLGDVFDDGDSILLEGTTGSACQRLGALAGLLAIETPDPRLFLRRLGREAAGIRSGARAFADLARGGEDRIPGRGFRGRFDDGSDGQARHFAGIAVAATYGGAATTRVISIFGRRDSPDSPDGLLTDEALLFTRLLRSGELPVADAGIWIREEICGPQASSIF